MRGESLPFLGAHEGQVADPVIEALQSVHQLGVTARDHPVRPLVVSSQPSQNVFLKLR
jgi:hypothetical protein